MLSSEAVKNSVLGIYVISFISSWPTPTTVRLSFTVFLKYTGMRNLFADIFPLSVTSHSFGSNLLLGSAFRVLLECQLGRFGEVFLFGGHRLVRIKHRFHC